jgi:hypothetical protein
MKEPKGEDLFATLIKLLAEQEGVKITYELETISAPRRSPEAHQGI